MWCHQSVIFETYFKESLSGKLNCEKISLGNWTPSVKGGNHYSTKNWKFADLITVNAYTRMWEALLILISALFIGLILFYILGHFYPRVNPCARICKWCCATPNLEGWTFFWLLCVCLWKLWTVSSCQVLKQIWILMFKTPMINSRIL